MFRTFDSNLCDKNITGGIFVDRDSLPQKISKNTRFVSFRITEDVEKINEKLSLAVELVRIYNKVCNEAKNKKFKKRMNIAKELGDIFARFTNRAVIDQESIDKVQDEIDEKFGVKVLYDAQIKQHYVGQDVRIYENKFGIYTSIIIRGCGKFVISYYPRQLKYLRTFDLSNTEIFYYSLIAFTSRIESHVTFSIKVVRDVIASKRYRGFGFIECFASPWNCQNYLMGKKVVEITYGLVEDQKIGIFGPFPTALFQNVQKVHDKFGKVLLLANPVFSEDHIIRMFAEFDSLLGKVDGMNVQILITLPWWDDLYSEMSDVFNSIKQKGYRLNWVLHKKDADVCSFHYKKNLKFNWYHVFVTR